MLVIAHRGVGKFEKSLKALKAAAEIGCDGVEIDVRKCADELVCIHDATLKRTTQASGSVLLYPFSKLEGYGIPKLDEILACAKKKRIPLHLHVKEGFIIDEIAECLKRNELKAEILTRDCNVAIKARKHDLPVRFNSHYQMLDFCKKIGIYAIDIRHSSGLGYAFGSLSSGEPFTVTLRKDFKEEWIRIVKEEGFKATYWLRNPKLIPYTKRMGIDAVTTDNPERILRRLERYGKGSTNALFEVSW